MAQVREVLTASGALDAVEELIAERYRTGLQALSATGLGEAEQALIAGLARAAIQRVA